MPVHNPQQVSDAIDDLHKRVTALEANRQHVKDAAVTGTSSGQSTLDEAIRRAKEGK